MIKVFYGTVVVENAHLIPKHGKGWCVWCSRSSNTQIYWLRVSQPSMSKPQQFANRCCVSASKQLKISTLTIYEQGAYVFAVSDCKSYVHQDIRLTIWLQNRHVVRFVAKDTLVYQKGFSGWLTRSIRAIPVKRKRDHEGSEVNNSDAMLKVLEVCDFVGAMVDLADEKGSSGARARRCRLLLSWRTQPFSSFT